MDSQPSNEAFSSAALNGADLPEPKVRMWVEVLVIVLFVMSLIGTWRLATVWPLARSVANAWLFYVDIALTVVPLVLLAVFLSVEVRVTEGLRLGGLYQKHLDHYKKLLASRETVLRLVSDYQSSAITIFDRHNRYWFLNSPAADVLAMEPNEIIGQPPIKVLPNEQAKKLEVRLAQTRTLDGPLEYVEPIADKTGKTKFVQYHYEMLSDESDLNGCVIVREDDLTSLFVERERRERTFKQVIATLVAVVDRRDPYAAGHSSRVGQLARAIAVEMELETTMVETAEISGSLMNFGKVLVPRHILTKTSALTSEELQRVRDSILTSADILSIIGFEGPVVPTLRQVLERFDGSGTPKGLKGDEILMSARIVTVANAFVAFVSPRAHREGLSFHEALSAMAREVNRAFDERVVIALTNYVENKPHKLDWLRVSRQETP